MVMTSANLIEATHLSYTYPRTSQPVLRDLSFAIPQGQVTAVLGSSGSGKSTLLLALAGIVPEFYGGEWVGELRVGKVIISAENPESTGVVEQVSIALQVPDTQLVGFRVQETIAFGLENQGIPTRFAPESSRFWPSLALNICAIASPTPFPAAKNKPVSWRRCWRSTPPSWFWMNRLLPWTQQVSNW